MSSHNLSKRPYLRCVTRLGWLLAMISSGPLLTAQVCSGNFGDNIFEAGDFGTGEAQVLTPDPQIAPGYLYETDPPPDDGEYSVVNVLTNTDIFADWLTIQDNSTDRDGYMMVVNASFEPGLFYEQTITDLCENVLYEFSADIINLIRAFSADRIDPNVSFLLDDEEVFTTGVIPKTERWNTYGFTFTTKPGQTTLKLSLRNNAPGGIGNDLALDNITFRPCGSTALILPETVQNICEDGEPIDITATVVGSAFENLFIQWQQSFDGGFTWEDLDGEINQKYTFDNLSSGDYYYRYLLADSEEKLSNPKCRTISNLKVVRVLPKFVHAADTLCQGLTLPFVDRELSSPGTYIDTLLNILGCDSIVTLDLSFVENQVGASLAVMDPTCANGSDGRISMDHFTGTPPFGIFFENRFTSSSVIGNLQDGRYRLDILDRYGCAWDTTVTIVDPPAFEVNLGPDQELILGERFQVNNFVSSPASDYSWTPPSVSCQPPCQSLDELFTSSTNLSLTAISQNGCEASDEVQVIIQDELSLFIPNVFTPNQDEWNNFFTVFPDPEVNAIEIVEELTIFNRAGQEVFGNTFLQPGVAEEGWDGTRSGQELPAGVYYYQAKVRFINGAVNTYAGYVSLMR